MNAKIEWLGQASDNTEAWDKYLRAVRGQLAASWNSASRAYRALESVRAEYGLPLVARPGEGPSPGAVTTGEVQSFVELGEMVRLMLGWADEAIAGKRKVGYNDAAESLEIEELPGDQVKLILEAGRPRIVDRSGQPITVEGDVPGQLGLHPIVWVGVIAVVAVSAYFIVDEACDTMETLAIQKTSQTLATEGAKLIASGAATPEQVEKNNTAILKGTAAVEAARGESKEKENESGVNKTVRTVAYVALGLGVLYVGAKALSR